MIAYGLENNARLRSAQTNVAIEAAGLDAAKAERMPRLDGFAGVSCYRYPSPVVPIYITPGSGITIPNFDTTLYDAGVTFTLPLYRGGRLSRKDRSQSIMIITIQQVIWNSRLFKYLSHL